MTDAKGEAAMHTFGRSKKGPDRAFSHGDDCKIQAADPTVSIESQEVEPGFWEARCVCGVETHRELTAGDRVRLSPFDSRTSCHLPQCEYISETDPSVLKLVLKATDRESYFWVACSACDAGWQVPYYAESVG